MNIRDQFERPGNLTPVSHETVQTWQEWLDRWKAQQLNYSRIENETKEWDYHDPDRPESWKGLKPGRKPQAPPWAVFPEDYGKPHICFLRPDGGYKCPVTTTSTTTEWWPKFTTSTEAPKAYRYFYYPSTRECRLFEYNGCGGNDNNFLLARRCRETCVSSGVSNCLLFGRRVNC